VDWSRFRQDELSFSSELVYLDYALRGLLPLSVQRATQEALEQAGRGRLARPAQAERVASLRRRLLELVGWTPAEAGVCLTANTTTALGLLAGSCPWRPGDRILLHEDEVASNRRVWRAAAASHDLQIVLLPSRGGRLELSDLAAACREPVRWASFAAVSLPTGEARPLGQIRALVSRAGGLLCVDAAQGAGCVSLAEADAVAGSGRKWLCGPPEVGFLVMRHSASEGLRPITAGGCSGEGVQVLEGGVPPLLPAIGLDASLKLLSELGWPEIQSALRSRGEEVRIAGQEAGWELAFDLPADRLGSIVHFRVPPGCPTDLQDQLESRGVIARVASEPGTLRVSPHAWTTRAEIEALVATTHQLIRE
jgi:cysteine desulfurase / selenocysteine lyase